MTQKEAKGEGSMSNEHRIASVLDMLKLTPEEFQRMLPDLCGWYAYTKAAEELGAVGKGFVWIDDNKPGELHSINVTVVSAASSRAGGKE